MKTDDRKPGPVVDEMKQLASAGAGRCDADANVSRSVPYARPRAARHLRADRPRTRRRARSRACWRHARRAEAAESTGAISELLSSAERGARVSVCRSACVHVRLRAFGVPNGIRTRVTAVKGRCPRPLDDGDARGGAAKRVKLEARARRRQVTRPHGPARKEA